MNLTKKIGLGIAAGVLTIGAGATAFAAGSPGTSGSGTPTGARAAFVCAHLDEVQAQQQAHLDLLNGRLHLLQEADDAAKTAGKDQAAAKIEQRIDRTTTKIAKVTDRQGKLVTWASTNCATAPTPAG
jgi:hypothetical protein